MCEIHDAARMDELRRANLQAAFMPMAEAAETEELFDYDIYVAEKNGRVDGFVAYSPDELAWLYISPEKYRLGIGSRLTKHAINLIGPDITIEVLKGNDAAYAFYAAQGFQLVETANGVMPGNETFDVTVHIMEYRGTQEPRSNAGEL